MRRIWQLPFNTHCILLPLITEQIPIEIICKIVEPILDKMLAISNTIKWYSLDNYILSVRTENFMDAKMHLEQTCHYNKDSY